MSHDFISGMAVGSMFASVVIVIGHWILSRN